MKKRLVLSVIGLVLTSISLSPASVEAAGSATCGIGFERATKNQLRTSSAPYAYGPGEQELFVKKVDAGWRWCLITDRVGAAEGVSGYTFAGLQRNSSSSYDAQDGNNYQSYAGPVYVTTKNKQINYKSVMHFNGRVYVHAGSYGN
jgi:hypothetical protein